jgi:hypothetical protein
VGLDWESIKELPVPEALYVMETVSLAESKRGILFDLALKSMPDVSGKA